MGSCLLTLIDIKRFQVRSSVSGHDPVPELAPCRKTAASPRAHSRSTPTSLGRAKGRASRLRDWSSAFESSCASRPLRPQLHSSGNKKTRSAVASRFASEVLQWRGRVRPPPHPSPPFPLPPPPPWGQKEKTNTILRVSKETIAEGVGAPLGVRPARVPRPGE